MLSQHCSIFGLFIVLHLSVISGDTPWIHPMHTIYKQYPEDIQHTSAAGYQGEFLSLSRDQLIHIKRMLRRVPYRNPLLDVIREAASQVERGLDIDVSMDDILPNPEDKLIELWNYDEEFQKIVTEYLSTVTQREIKFLSNTNDIPYPEERNQTQGHFGCIPDFDSYIGPITKLLDAIGRRPTGFYEGHLHWVGSYEECTTQVINHVVHMGSGLPLRLENRTFRGRYARLDMPVPLSIFESNDSLPYSLGTCVPDTCTKEDVWMYIMY
ncbi:hypothetical protein LSH36_444g02040, partial [Paralvinella palmiformis]